MLATRFRGFFPVVVDVETGGFNPKTDALLEISAICLRMDEQGFLVIDQQTSFHVEPFVGANIEQSAIDFIGIDPHHPLRIATPELEAISEVFSLIRTSMKQHVCTRAVLVGHNAFFDLQFVNACAERNGLKRNPFHPFTCFDTATLSGLMFGQTVLPKACLLAGIEFDPKNAHSASYDTLKTAELFCAIVNRWKTMGGWPLAD